MDEMLSLHITQLIPPEHAAKVPERMAKIHEKGFAVFESAQIRKDGTRMPVEVNSRLLEHEGRQVFFSIVRDITERKEAGDKLIESEERYRMLFNSVNDAVLVHDIGEDGLPGKFTASNDIACDLYGYSKAEFAEMTPADINDPERATSPVPIVNKLLKEKHVLFETVDKKKDGSSIPVEISSHLFEFKGKPIIISAIRDITERKKVENTLKENKYFIEAIIESTPT
jgi:PAS domain S-box-containing protein